MAEANVERRLAAIVIADVVGYSKLIREDETGTLARFQELQRTIFQPRIDEYGGRVVKTMGDSFLLEFPSAVAALACSVSVQRQTEAHEAERPGRGHHRPDAGRGNRAAGPRIRRGAASLRDRPAQGPARAW